MATKKKKDLTERKRKELLHFIKTVGGSSIWVMYNCYLKESGCKALIPDGVDNPILDA